MNERERQICSRLKELRERLGHSQRIFAALLKIKHDQLASIEYGRTPLRIEVVFSLARLTGCNLYWLAEGDGPVHRPLPNPNFTTQIPHRCLFSRAWRTWLKGGLRPGAKEFGEGSANSGANVQDYLIEEVTGVLKFLPPELHPNFFAHITKAGRDFVGTNQAAITKSNNDLKINPQKSLTSISLKSKEWVVKSEIKKLIERVKRKAAKPGAKSQLARELGVAPARISEWLAGEKEPGGEYTLKLLRWVEHPECQK